MSPICTIRGDCANLVAMLVYSTPQPWSNAYPVDERHLHFLTRLGLSAEGLSAVLITDSLVPVSTAGPGYSVTYLESGKNLFLHNSWPSAGSGSAGVREVLFGSWGGTDYGGHLSGTGHITHALGALLGLWGACQFWWLWESEVRCLCVGVGRHRMPPV